MSASWSVRRIGQIPSVNFLVTNRLPRRAATRFMGWFSRIEQPLVRDVSIWLWQVFGGPLSLEDAKKSTFASVHDCFTRELRPGARTIDRASSVLVSPCDAIVGECGAITNGQLIQAKGIAYTLDHLLLDSALARAYEGGAFATLRLTSTMYHRFHAPYDCEISRVTYVPGDTWNVNPATLERKPGVFCMNERAIIEASLAGLPGTMALVPIAAILVAGIHLAFLDTTFGLDSPGPRRLTCLVGAGKGDELGHFRHGSTIVMLVSPGIELASGIRKGVTIRMGVPLFQRS